MTTLTVRTWKFVKARTLLVGYIFGIGIVEFIVWVVEGKRI